MTAFNCFEFEPLRIAVAGIFEIRRHRAPAFVAIDRRVDIVPHVNAWLDHVEILEFQRVTRVVAGDQQFVQFFARPDADRLLLAVADQSPRPDRLCASREFWE